MIVGEWLERAAIDCLSTPNLDLPITDSPCCLLLQFISPDPTSTTTDEPCRAHLADTHYHCLAILSDHSMARLLLRYSSQPLCAFAGSTIALKRARMQAVRREAGVVMVLVVDEFVVWGGLVAGSEDVGRRVSVMKSEAVISVLKRLEGDNVVDYKESEIGDSYDHEDKVIFDAEAEPEHLCNLLEEDEQNGDLLNMHSESDDSLKEDLENISQLHSSFLRLEQCKKELEEWREGDDQELKSRLQSEISQLEAQLGHFDTPIDSNVMDNTQSTLPIEEDEAEDEQCEAEHLCSDKDPKMEPLEDKMPAKEESECEAADLSHISSDKDCKIEPKVVLQDTVSATDSENAKIDNTTTIPRKRPITAIDYSKWTF